MTLNGMMKLHGAVRTQGYPSNDSHAFLAISRKRQHALKPIMYFNFFGWFGGIIGFWYEISLYICDLYVYGWRLD
jgi:hypothetical protein